MTTWKKYGIEMVMWSLQLLSWLSFPDFSGETDLGEHSWLIRPILTHQMSTRHNKTNKHSVELEDKTSKPSKHDIFFIIFQKKMGRFPTIFLRVCCWSRNDVRCYSFAVEATSTTTSWPSKDMATSCRTAVAQAWGWGVGILKSPAEQNMEQ